MSLPAHAQRGLKPGRQPGRGVESVLIRKRRAAFLPVVCHRQYDVYARPTSSHRPRATPTRGGTLYDMPDVVYVCVAAFHQVQLTVNVSMWGARAPLRREMGWPILLDAGRRPLTTLEKRKKRKSG